MRPVTTISIRAFTLTFRLQFDGKGAAWVIRAKDRSNYYLFETQWAAERQSEHAHLLYLPRRVPKEIDRKVIPGKLAKDDQFRVTVEARGDKFIVWLYTNSNPTPTVKAIRSGIFKINPSLLAGVGFRSKDGIEMLLKFFNIRPEK